MQGEKEEPDVITYLRGCSTDPENVLAAIVIGRSPRGFGPLARGLGIRPRVLERREDGTKVYGLSGAQVAKVLDIYDKGSS